MVTPPSTCWSSKEENNKRRQTLVRQKNITDESRAIKTSLRRLSVTVHTTHVNGDSLPARRTEK